MAKPLTCPDCQRDYEEHPSNYCDSQCQKPGWCKNVDFDKLKSGVGFYPERN